MKYLFTLVGGLLMGSFFSFSLAQIPLPASLPARVMSQPETDKSLQFIQNKNQWPASVRFAADLPDGRIFLQDAGFVYNFIDGTQLPSHHGSQSAAIKAAATSN